MQDKAKIRSILSHLEPISRLSPNRLKELASLCFIENVSKDIDPFRMNVVKNAQAMFLIKGDLELHFADDSIKILRGGSQAAKRAINVGRVRLKGAMALTEIKIIRIDQDLLDIMMTWDQLAGYEKSVPQAAVNGAAVVHRQGTGEWMRETSAFSVGELQNGVFSQLPPSNVEEMFRRMAIVPVKADQVIITQGTEGDYYYLIERGIALVSRSVNADESMLLAELKKGDAFGEEALASDNKRNATVTMKTDGILLRLNKNDFVELLKAPLINQISLSDAKQKVQTGAFWLDVRFPSEYNFDHLPNALNTPLNEIRDLMNKLQKDKQYIAYCQTGRRSTAAAFILAQHGFNVLVLEGGTKARSQ